jgi:hypothetical protein
LKFPLPAPVFSSHPEYQREKKANPASRQTYCGPSIVEIHDMDMISIPNFPSTKQ